MYPPYRVEAGLPARSYGAVPAAGVDANVVLLERVDPFRHHGMKSVVLPAVDLLPASSIAITVMTLSPCTPYALGVMF